MDIKTFFNVLLLALSLATVLVTLVSFILYKLRQLADKNQIKDPYQLEGLYFTRIAPHLDELNKKYRLENQIQVKKVNSKLSLGSMFLIIVGIIASSLFAQIYFTDIQERRKKIAISENYRQLVDQGLLKRYDYTPQFEDNNLKYKSEQSHVGFYDYLIGRLKSKKIILAVSENTNKSTDYSFNSWEQFFAKYEIPFKVQKISQVQNAELVILPKLEILKNAEKASIENLQKNGVALLATGPIGRLDGTREKTDGSWASQFFGIEFKKCPDTTSYPVFFIRSTQMLLNIPNNYTSNWPQINKEYCAHTKINSDQFQIGSVEVSYEGLPRYIDKSQKYLIINSVLQNKQNSRTIWQSMDPLFSQKNDVHQVINNQEEFNYDDLIILQSMHWLVHGIEVQISDWPNNFESMSVISFPYLIDNAKSDQIVNHLIKLKIPATVFLGSGGIQLFKETLNGKNLGSLELAAYFDQYYPPLSDKIEINKLDFKDIEKNRLDIEEEASQPVNGIYIRPDKINKSVYYSTITNQLKYIVTSGIENGQILHQVKSQRFLHFNIPDPETNEKMEKESRSLASINEQIMMNNFSNLKSHHFYDLDSTTKDRIDQLISQYKQGQLTTYQAISDWLLKRAKINLIIHEGKDSDKEIHLTVQNNNEEEIGQLHLLLGRGQWILNDENKDLGQVEIKDQILIIQKLKSLEKLTVSLKRMATQ